MPLYAGAGEFALVEQITAVFTKLQGLHQFKQRKTSHQETFIGRFFIVLQKYQHTSNLFENLVDALMACALGLQHPFFFVDFIFIEYVCLLHDQLKNIGYGGSDGDKNEKCKTSSIPMKLGHITIGNSQILHAKKYEKNCVIYFKIGIKSVQNYT